MSVTPARRMPIGIQDFEKLRKFGCVYVDKTGYVWKLVSEPAPYFLSRPRRFGKSLLLTTLKAYFLEIGMTEKYAGLCGITESELLRDFRPELEELAKKNGEGFEETLEAVRRNFNGYHFCENSEGVFNPFSLLNTFDNKRIGYYWFATGTPTFLFGELARTGFDLKRFGGRIEISEFEINEYRSGDMNPVPLLYQSGYLTITGYDRELRAYSLGFPNEEVKYGFLDNLCRYLFPAAEGRGLDVLAFTRALRAGEVDGFLTELRAFFASIPYDLYFAKGESYYQTVFYLVFTLLGQFAEAEVRSGAGRADAVVKTRDRVYVFEFKLDSGGTAEEALEQIEEKGYLLPYSAGGRRLVKVGVVFDTEKRTLGEWRVA